MAVAVRSRMTDASDAAQPHSAYLYGSIPRGTAIPDGSDLELLPAPRAGREPTAECGAAHGPKARRR
ncbi:hypothetical protein ACFCW6_14350 [Streptomyces sp. NPDC056333]|uniref:hypothetical protein n=1 Tax=Streptomyces sp. NPDC056333 TaxID=3345786 RepID=UPI0035E0B0DD